MSGFIRFDKMAKYVVCEGEHSFIRFGDVSWEKPKEAVCLQAKVVE